MLLSGHNIAHYLLDKNYISNEVFVNGALTIKPLSSRNFCFLIKSNYRAPIFIKQVRAIDNEKTTSLRAEANMYWLAQQDSAYKSLQPFIPVLLEYDYTNHILVTEAFHNAESLLEFHYRTRTFPTDLAKQMALILANLHQEVTHKMMDGKSRQLFKESMPVIFRIEESQLQHWYNKNEASKLFVKLVQETEHYLPMIMEVRKEWVPSCLIHHDVKNANFLVVNKEQAQLKLIDWEITSYGDPCWDLAAVIQSYFLFWIEYSIQQEPSYSIPGIENNGFELDQMSASIQTFWQIYSSLRNWSPEQAEKEFIKTMKFCALKLIHTCTEASQQYDHMQPTSAAMLQLSYNILKDPEAAINSLIQNPQIA